MSDLPEYIKDCEKINSRQIALLSALIDCTCVDTLEQRKKQIKAELVQLQRNLALQAGFLVKNCDIT